MAKRVLLVDDSSTILMMERMILQRSSYVLATACDGAEALRIAKEQRPDLILMDVVMPKVDGFEALRALRADDATKDIPVVMVTTRAEAHNVEAGFAIGCNDYVTKPINSVELVAKLRNILGE